MIAFFGLLLFFVLDYIRPTSFVPALQVLHLNSLVPLAVVLLTLIRRPRPADSLAADEPSNVRMVVGLFGLIVASAAFADVTERVFNVATVVVGYTAISWAITEQVSSLERLKTVVKVLLVVHLVVAAMNPVMFTDPDGRHYLATGAFLGDGNDFALSVNLVVPLCLFLMADARSGTRKVLWALAFIVCIASVVLTKSRGATVALVCVGAYYWTKSDRKITLLAGAVLVVGMIVALAPPSYFERMSQIADSQEGSAQGRIQAWWGGTRMALDYPLTGVGAGHFPIAYGTTYRLSQDIPWQTAHSIYFLALGELGFPGLGLLLAIIIRNLRANSRLISKLEGLPGDPYANERQLIVALNASLIGFASGGAFLSALYYPHIYVLAGLLTAARRLVRERIAAPGAAIASPGRLPAPVPGQISAEWRPSPAALAPPLSHVLQRR